MTKLVEFVLATRPWSFTAAAVPILISAAVCKVSLLSEVFLRAFVMGIAIQAGANLTNTYFDYVNGLDTKDGGEKTLVEGKLSAKEVWFLSVSCYACGLIAIVPYLLQQNILLTMIFAFGVFLAYYYTANPVGLKYKALGDIAIFLCFGPLLMQCCSILFTGELRPDLYLYAVPIGLLTELILHVNNVRDIKQDARAGAITVANLLGENLSYLMFLILLGGSYVALAYIAYYYHWGCLAAFVTMPLAFSLNSTYLKKNNPDIPGEVAQLHLPFGLLMMGGILMTSRGLVP
jgi:1,4-dihydroxy-2-naphthoate octaprenyltransferase